MSASYRRLLLGPALFAMFAAPACGTGSDSGETGGETSAAGNTEQAAETTPAEPEAPTAADGTDYTACGDGSCEVVVSGESVDFSFPDFTLTVKVTEDGIETHTADSDDTRSGSSNMNGPGMSDAYCVAYLSAGSNTMSCYPDTEPGDMPAPESEPGVLVLEMLDFTEGTAVIRLTMG